jgi:hypothetical protein
MKGKKAHEQRLVYFSQDVFHWAAPYTQGPNLRDTLICFGPGVRMGAREATWVDC